MRHCQKLFLVGRSVISCLIEMCSFSAFVLKKHLYVEMFSGDTIIYD